MRKKRKKTVTSDFDKENTNDKSNDLKSAKVKKRRSVN